MSMSAYPAPSPEASLPSAPDAWSRYAAFLRRPPEIVLEWNDRETEARGWLVINSLRGGAAGGGTRMRAGLTRREVTYLAKTMELKFSYSGPLIGGAKSGIDFDPSDPRREGVLRRWFAAAASELRVRYGTGGDLNVDEVEDVIPACHALGISHPQEGVVRGHLRADPERQARILEALDLGVRAPVRGPLGIPGMELPVADLVTGYGLAVSILELYRLQGREVEGARVRVEGFGAVGAPCALYLARAGMRVVALDDREKTLFDPRGLDAQGMEELMRRRLEKLLPREDSRCLRGEERRAADDAEVELFVAAAASETIDAGQLERLAGQGVEVIACGANQPFHEEELGDTRIAAAADGRFSVIPDVVANCGMARVFSYLMEEGSEPAAEPVLEAVRSTIADAVRSIHQRNAGRRLGLLSTTLGQALDATAQEGR
jgi:glutamate dehydrogenase/leucine dehydrogenase